jgi:hypothetical protein
LAGAVLARVAVLAAFPFDGLYGQDAYAYYDYAGVLRAALAHGNALPPFVWPLGYPLHIALLSLVTGVTPPAGQWTSLLAGALAVPLTYALAREALWRMGPARGRRAGVVAALVVALAAQSLVSSVSTMADMVALAWATASAWLLLRYARTAAVGPFRFASTAQGTLALASFALGVAVITRWGNALLVLPWGMAILAAWRARGPAFGMRRATAAAALAVLCGGAVVGAQLTTGSHTGYLELFSWSPSNAFLTDVTNPDGAFHYALPPGLFYAQPLVHPSYLFPLLAPLWCLGLIWLVRRGALPTRVLLLGWPLVYYLFLAGGTRENPRFALAYFSPLAIFAGVGFDVVWQARPAWRQAAIALLALALLGAGVWSVRVVGNFVEHNKTIPLTVARYADERLPPGVRVLTFGLTLTLSHYTDLEAIDLYHETPETLRKLACGDTEAYVYVDPANLAEQWSGLVPETNFRWVVEEAGVEEMGGFEGYVLYKAGGKCLR